MQKKPRQHQFSIRLTPELYKSARQKCRDKFGIGLSPLIKIFLHSFVSQAGVGFYVGDEDLCRLYYRWLLRKRDEIGRKDCAPMPGPRLHDLFHLNLIEKYPGRSEIRF
jgi:hypothetical protein